MPGSSGVEVRDGLAVVPFPAVMGDGVADAVVRRFSDQTFTSCPLAAVVAPGCPTAAGELSWIRDIVEASNVLAVKLSLADFAERPAPVLVDGLVALVGERKRAALWKPKARKV